MVRWTSGRQSDNIEDRRGAPRGRMAVGGGLGMLVLIVVALLLGVDPRALFNAQQGLPPGQQQLDPGGPPVTDPAQEELKAFVGMVLADTEEVWREQFQQMGKAYREPKLVLFTDQVDSACGFASAASGPFYCPTDQKVYIDLAFYQQLRDRMGAPGDFAQAYVIAHEIGHHVQNQLGILDQVHSQQGRVSQEEYNELSVRLELQADFLAGVWAHHAQKARQILETGDIEEGLQAASAIGDDHLQREAQGFVVPESFTHGTSEQRVRWFKKGLQTGDIEQGDTFNAEEL